MKSFRCLIAVLLLPLCVTTCNLRKASSQNVELMVFAASSMKETLEQIVPLYKQTAPNVKLVFVVDSVGSLRNQIQRGAECDIFISAAQRQMDLFDITANPQVNTEGLDIVLQGTRIDFLENRVALCVPEGNPAGIKSFADWANRFPHEDILFAMGNSEVAVGQYTRRIFSFFKFDEDVLAYDGKIIYGSNVQKITSHIKGSKASCGVVYCTDAYSAGLEIVDYATAEMCGQIIYPVAVMKTGKNPDAAIAFMDYLKSDEAMAVFEKVGFVAAWR